MRYCNSIRLRYWVALFLCCTLGFAGSWEARTSDLQSWFFHRWSSTLHYSIESAPNPQIAFPRSGPFDERRGYTRLPQFTERLQTYGFHISAQASQTPQLAELIHNGIAPPYRESPVAGLIIRDSAGAAVFNSNANVRLFQRFEQVPPLLAETLLFIENRSMGDHASPRQNPAIDWQRSSKAALSYGARKIGLNVPLEGGSTLATQLNKYRHSADGRTLSPTDKLRQIVGASLAAYQEGRDTQETRKQIVVDYLNTMPLSATHGGGDVHGLGDGLRAWFNMDLMEVCAALQSPGASPAKARAYRHVLALLYAVHAPTYYLITDRRRLESRIDTYAELLQAAGILDSRLARLMKTIPLEFAARWTAPEPPQYIERKAINAVRIGLSQLLHVDRLYDVDRLDLQVDSTIDTRLQEDVTRILRQLGSPDFVTTHGLLGPRLLTESDPTEVTYSFLLLESRPEGNLVRVRADTLNAPFDINGEMKLELGSTAKLRTLAHYLDVMAQLYDELLSLDPATLEQDAADPRYTAYPRDTLTRWAAGTLLMDPGLGLEEFLNRALDRRYSASPAEVFFTAGGIHTFGNFDPEENDLVMSVRDALVHSTNLVFIRLMRDIVGFHAARLPYDAHSVLTQSDDPARQRLLTEIGDKEARQSLAQAYRHYRGLRPPQILQRLLGSRTRSPRDLALVFYAWHAGEKTDASTLERWLTEQTGAVVPIDAERLRHTYGSPGLGLADLAYLLRSDALELWCAGELARNPEVSWVHLLSRSLAARQLASVWLFRTRNHNAQDLRLRIRIEQDAFARMTPFWRNLGFPFETLVPSYATAIGSSADRPIALAELMGIILNNGVRRPMLDTRRLTFADGTPYQTVFERTADRGRSVMRPTVAKLLREILEEVVERGTAIRISHVFVDDGDMPLPFGGKTGSGDNRRQAFARGGRLISSRPVNRTAGFVFYLGDRWFGVITATVEGPQAARYIFTSSLPLAILKLLAPALTKMGLAPEQASNPESPSLPQLRSSSGRD